MPDKTCLLTSPINDYIPTVIKNTMTSSYDYEIFGSDVVKSQMPYMVNKTGTVALFENMLSDVSASVEQFPTSKTFQLSKEADFIKRYNLQDALKQAQLCVLEILSHTSTSLEYGKDSDLEWLDFNLHYDSVDGLDIESLLDKVDELSSKFEKKVGINVASNINFYLDIK